MTKFLTSMWLYLNNHPAAKNLLAGVVHCLTGALLAYLGMTMAPGHQQVFTWGGLAIALTGSWRAWIQHNNDMVLAFLQDQLQAITGAPAGQVTQLLNQVRPPRSSMLSPVKAGMLIFGLLFLVCGSSMAWELPSKALGGERLKLGHIPTMAAPSLSEDDFLLLPLSDANLSLTSKNSYGLGVCYALVFANVAPLADNNNIQVSPYGFVGLGLSVNAADWISSGGSISPGLDYGVVFGLPQLDKGVPEIAVQLKWEAGHPGEITTIDATFPLQILDSALIFKL